MNLRLTHIYTNMEKPLQWLAKNIKEQLPAVKGLQLDLGREEFGERYWYKHVVHVIDTDQFKDVNNSNKEASREDEDDSKDVEGLRGREVIDDAGADNEQNAHKQQEDIDMDEHAENFSD